MLEYVFDNQHSLGLLKSQNELHHLYEGGFDDGAA